MTVHGGSQMKLVLHDYSGHPFQVQMSRELARRGHQVTHVYFKDFQTPHGSLAKAADDPDGFDIRGLSLGVPFQKATFIKRRSQEIAYGRKLADLVRELQPDMVISSNAPLDAQRQVLDGTRKLPNAGFVFWLQDLYGEAILRILQKKLPLAGSLIGHYYCQMEARMLKESDQIISISDDFAPILRAYGVPDGQINIIENWAPLDEIARMPKRNPWSIENGLADKVNIIYSGTLGYKHNPQLLVRLAQELDATVTIFSEGQVADDLRQQSSSLNLANLVIRPWVPFNDLPSVLASADILVALIEPEAGVFSVPSKVLTYMCVGRPILGSIPSNNLAARLISREQAGVVVPPNDADRFVAGARSLLEDTALREQMGRNGRAYAERSFDIGTLADRFEQVLGKARGRNARAAAA